MNDRIPLDTLTSDALDALYERLAELQNADAVTAKILAKVDEDIDGAHEVARYFKALAAQAKAWGEQHRDRANRYRARTDAVTAELTSLNGETAGLNPYAMAGRRDAVARVRAALQSISHDTPVPDDPRVVQLEADVARLTAGQCLDRLSMCQQHHTPPVTGCPYPQCVTARQQQAPPVHLAKGTNAEDCPACHGTNPDYPFLCPGPEQPTDWAEPHLFERNPDADTVRVCRCGKWPDHHIHTGSTIACGCDTCRTTEETHRA